VTVRSTTQIHFGEGDVSHRHAAAYNTFEIADGTTQLYLHFETPVQIDEVIAELVALRAEMTAEPQPEAQECTDYDPGYKLHGCELDAGHDGPHRDLLGVEWAETLTIPCSSYLDGYKCTLHKGHFPARHRDTLGNEWTDAIYDASGPRKPQVAAVAS